MATRRGAPKGAAPKKSRPEEVAVPEWLVLGSFPHPQRARILSWPYLDEENLAPSAGQKVAAYPWRRVPQMESGVDLLGLGLPFSRNCAAYAFAYLHAAAAGPARLLVGSDNGVSIWLNGEKVWYNDVQSALLMRQDVVDVKLAKGWNRLLLKISQFEGGWQFSCRVLAASALKFSLKSPFPASKAAKGKHDGALLADVADLARVGARIAVKTAAYNAGARAARGARIALVDAGGRAVAEGALDTVQPFGFASAALEVDLAALAALASSADSRIEVVAGGRKTVSPLPEDMAARLVATAGGAESLDDEARALIRQMTEISSTFEAARPVLRQAASSFAASIASGDLAALKRDLAETLDRALASVPDRKGDIAHVVGHAHIDMNWLWTYPETVASCHDTFRQVIAFMDEFEGFTFLQSQVSTYRAIEEIDPPLFERIGERVRSGRWELAGGAVSEGDTNMSSGEAIARTFLLGQRYFLDRFGKAACVGWLPDNFGHVSQLPQILRLAGCEFFYFHRCAPHKGTFWWEGPDGSRVLCFSNWTYNGRVDGAIVKDVATMWAHGLLHVVGVGDHGGGPTRADIEAVPRLNAMPRFPTVRFSTAEAFFRAARDMAAGAPVHRGEMQYAFPGCYTSIARVKAGNRRCEAALYAAELLASLGRIGGGRYPAAQLREAWEIVAFNQFHDILCGSAIHESNQDSVADYKRALTRAEGVRDNALRALADQVRTDTSLGQPVVVFNPQPRERTSVVRAEVFTHEQPACARLSHWGSYPAAWRVQPNDLGQGPVASVLVRDAEGRSVPAQVVWGKDFPPGFRWRVAFVAEGLPAGGYRTYYVDAARPGEFNEPVPVRNGVFDTDHLRVAFDMKTGELAGVFDKRAGRELVAKGERANRLRVYMEKPHGMSAWEIGPISRAEDVAAAESVAITEWGPVRACVEAVKRWGKSKFVQRTYVYRSYPRIDFQLEAHWFEQGDGQTDAPMLRAVFPLALDAPCFDCQVPFDVVARPADGQEVPAQQFVDVSDGRSGVALLNRTKYGHSFGAPAGASTAEKRELRLTLLRSSYDPDIYPDQGLHFINYALFPHAGDWKWGVWSESEAFNVPPLATEPPSMALGKAHATRPAEEPLVSLAPAGAVLGSLKESEEGGELVARIVEVEGVEADAALTLPVKVASARRLDMVERPLDGAAAPRVEGRTVRVKLRPHEIVTLGIAT